MSKQSLNVANAKAVAKAQAIGAALVTVGEALGTYSVVSLRDKATATEAITAGLKAAMKNGMTVEMMGAPSSKNGGECFTAIVDGINAIRAANELEPMEVRVRDNYMSKMRAFVRDRGANPLDLYGNLASAKASKGKPKAEKVKASSAPAQASNDDDAELDEPNPVNITRPAVVDMNGIKPLQTFLAAWIEVNTNIVANQLTGKMAQDLLNAINVQLPPAGKKGKKLPVTISK